MWVTIKELAYRTGKTIPSILLGLLKGDMSDELDRNPEATFCDDLLSVIMDTSLSQEDPSPEQLEVIIRELKARGIGYCECCDEIFDDSYTVLHRWCEPPDYYPIRVAVVCLDCKKILTPKRLWKPENINTNTGWMEHVLPSFSLQKIAVRAGDESSVYKSSLKSAYVLPLPMPFWWITELWLDE